MNSEQPPKVFTAPNGSLRHRAWLLIGLLPLFIVIVARNFQTQRPEPPVIVVTPTTPVTTNALPVRAPNRAEIIEALKPHLLAHLPFAGSLNDHSAHALKAEARGSVKLDEDSAFFPGDAYLELPHLEFNDRPFAVAMWLKPEGQVRNYGLLEQNEGPPHKHLFLMLRTSDKPCLGFFMDDLSAPENVRSGEWSHLVFQFTGAQQQIWLNGRMIASRTSDPYKGESGATLIGKAPRMGSADPQGYRGHMRELRIYDRDLNETQIRALAGIELGSGESAKQPDGRF